MNKCALIDIPRHQVEYEIMLKIPLWPRHCLLEETFICSMTLFIILLFILPFFFAKYTSDEKRPKKFQFWFGHIISYSVLYFAETKYPNVSCSHFTILNIDFVVFNACSKFLWTFCSVVRAFGLQDKIVKYLVLKLYFLSILVQHTDSVLSVINTCRQLNWKSINIKTSVTFVWLIRILTTFWHKQAIANWTFHIHVCPVIQIFQIP